MRQITITIILTLNLFAAFGQGITKEQPNVVSNFIDCIKNQKKEKLLAQIYFPFHREYPIPQIKNRQEFLKRYNEVFDDKLIKMIVNSNPATDWSAAGWRGIMLFRGDVWLDYNGKLISVPYQSKYEAKKKEELISLEKRKLHQSIKKFKRPICILETTKYRIRIDDLGKGNFRYASWPLRSKMSDKPDIVIQNGEQKPEGSGGNCSYDFRSGEYTYTCAIIVTENARAYLTIYKGDKEILSHKADIVTK